MRWSTASPTSPAQPDTSRRHGSVSCCRSVPVKAPTLEFKPAWVRFKYQFHYARIRFRPTVTAQSGLPTQQAQPPQNPAQAIDEGKQWDYRLDFQSLNAPQDTDHVQAVFNTPPANGFGAFGLSRTDLVFQALAEFIDAYPRLITDLAILTKLSPGQFDNTAAVAVQVLDTFAASVAQALSASSMAGDIFGLQWPELKYLYKLQSSAASGELKELRFGDGIGSERARRHCSRRLHQEPDRSHGWDRSRCWIPPARFAERDRYDADFEYPAGFAINTSITQRFLLKRVMLSRTRMLPAEFTSPATTI